VQRTPVASLEVTKDMRARIRASFALLVAVALVLPGPALAQAAQTAVQASPAPAAAPAGETLQLTLDEAVKRALENNADLAVARYNPELSQQSVLGAQGAFDPVVYSTLSKSSQDTEGTTALAGGNVVNTQQDVWNFGTSVPLRPTGGTFTVDFNNFKRDTDNAFTTLNPLYSSNLSIGLDQPLLRNFRIDASRNQLRIAKKNREISDVQFKESILTTTAQVKIYYYQLIYSIDALAAAQKNLELAKKLLQENEIRVKVGTMAPLDVVQAQSEVAAREEGVIIAENNLAQAEDNLKEAIFAQNDPAMWSTRIVPADRPTAEPFPVDANAAVRNALESRTDIVAARKGLERADYNVQYFRNQLLPDLNLFATYGGAGAGGTTIVREPPIGGDIVETIPGGYGDAIDEVFGRDFPNWRVGVQFAYAIPNRSAKASAASARISKEQALASFRRLELNVAAEVRTAARAVESGFKRVQSTGAARVLAAQRLDAEEKKFAAGMSTNFLVTQAQRDLADAESAELRAVAEYRIAIVNFGRVQESGLSTAGGVAVLSGSTSGSQASQALRSGAASSAVQGQTGGF
jgi:outer membrane protein TolC